MHHAGVAELTDLAPPAVSLRDEVLAGLARPQKTIAPKFFYDARGCELFDAICVLPEYYPTRTELAIMRTHAADMAAVLGEGCALIEIGCGSGEKTRLLLEHLAPPVFVPVDIAAEQLKASCDTLARAFPDLRIVPVRADFALPVTLPPVLDGQDVRRRVLYFPGSTIGNFNRGEAFAFLERWKPLLGADGALLIGVDLKKDPGLLRAAYNDAAGVTAQFNLNLLVRFNRELGADFDLAAFRHKAFYDGYLGRVEMHLESLRAQTVTVAGRRFGFAAGETIHTEISCKYSLEEFRALGRDAGYAPVAVWTDPARLFAVHCFAEAGS
ncbi:MAG: L-histidine N(alpha)-methyltransferase [Burkholderiales bacterium]